MAKYLTLLIAAVLFSQCNPYATKRLSFVKRAMRADSVYVTYPVVDCKRQSNTSSWADWDSFEPAISMTQNAMHLLLDGRVKATYESTRANVEPQKELMDSILNNFKTHKYSRFHLPKKHWTQRSELVLIPYLVWIRSTEDYDKDACGYSKYYRQYTCTWTEAQAHILILDNRRQEAIYFRYNQWNRGGILMPFQKRITKSFYRCTRHLLRKMGTGKKARLNELLSKNI